MNKHVIRIRIQRKDDFRQALSCNGGTPTGPMSIERRATSFETRHRLQKREIGAGLRSHYRIVLDNHNLATIRFECVSHDFYVSCLSASEICAQFQRKKNTQKVNGPPAPVLVLSTLTSSFRYPSSRSRRFTSRESHNSQQIILSWSSHSTYTPPVVAR
jgi:hypothetical protein